MFYCDIVGTFYRKKDFKDEDQELERFVNNLNSLMIKNNTSKLIFSFITTENEDFVNKMEEKIKPYIEGTNILLGNHIYDDGKKIVSKPVDILKDIERQNKKHNIDKKIYYADDCELYHSILNELNGFYGFDYDIQSIVPQYNDLYDVNNILENQNYNRAVK